MAYSKQTWDTTSYVNPTRMNHIEQGIYDASIETDYTYDLNLINGWGGNVKVNVSTKNQIVAIQGYIDATNATSTTFCNADTNLMNCYNNKLLPVSGQGLAIKANQAHEYSISFNNSGGWHAVISQKSTIALVNVYARA